MNTMSATNDSVAWVATWGVLGGMAVMGAIWLACSERAQDWVRGKGRSLAVMLAIRLRRAWSGAAMWVQLGRKGRATARRLKLPLHYAPGSNEELTSFKRPVRPTAPPKPVLRVWMGAPDPSKSDPNVAVRLRQLAIANMQEDDGDPGDAQGNQDDSQKRGER